MAENRTVTVSITINLGNYENLRLEVSDKAETKEEADALRYFLVDILDGYGNNNATAKAAIDKYKERILADTEKESEAFTFEDTPMPFVPAEEIEYSIPEPIMPEPVNPEPVMTDFEPEAAEEPAAPPTSDAEFTCSKCGAPVTKLQRDVSMLFNHKILCKDCMK